MKNVSEAGVRIGILIREYRKRSKFSQAYLAKHAGIGQYLISQVERGEREPSFYMVERIARILHIPILLLFGSEAVELGYERILKKLDNIDESIRVMEYPGSI